LVWNASVDIVQGLFQDVWAGQDVVTVDHITLPFLYSSLELLVRTLVFAYSKWVNDAQGSCYGFGRSFSWKDDDVVPPGHTMTFK